MGYISVGEGRGYKEVYIVHIPMNCEMTFVNELRESVLEDVDEEVVFIRFSGEYTDGNGLYSLGCRDFNSGIREILYRLLFQDRIYIGLVDKPIYNLELEILLALDYIKYLEDIELGFTSNYLPLSAGTTYALFRGGINLLNLLYNRVRLSQLMSMGFIRGEKVDSINHSIYLDVGEALKIKKLYREIFLRESQHIGSVESNMYFRI
ncbi:TPA: hypothetical protein EYP83_04380 [Candidatus Geothermarchaeota archaeon]|nr:hypothetical protein [Candidatus Geothermarchaeota archaeon]HIQ13590.1 hypothetical protein [Thermoprotei archaeon]